MSITMRARQVRCASGIRLPLPRRLCRSLGDHVLELGVGFGECSDERWLVGLMAGAVFNLVLYRTKSLYACMIAHGVTNLAPAI